MEPPWQDIGPLLVIILQWTWVQSSSQPAVRHTTRSNHQKHTDILTVVTKLDPPYMMLKKESPFLMGNERFEGYLADLIQRLSESIGFQYKIKLVNDGRYGVKDKENGTWNGIIGQLIRGESDIGLAPLIVNVEKSRVIDFTKAFLSFRSTALLKKPRRRKSRIKTLPELIAKWTVHKGIVQDGPIQEFFSRTSNPTYSRMWSLMTNTYPSVLVHNVEEGTHRARRGDYAFIIDGPKAEYLTYLPPCDLYTTEYFLDMRHYALGLPKGSRWKNVINSEMTRMKRNGQLDFIYMRWWRNQCNARRVTKARDAKNKHKKNRKKFTESVSRVTAIAVVNNKAVVIQTPVTVLLTVTVLARSWIY